MAEVPRIEAPERLETERLVLLRPTHEHTEPLIDLATDDRVARTLGGAQSRDMAWRNAASVMGHWVIRGYGLYSVLNRSSGQFIGRIGYLQPEGWPGLEVGWTLAADHWGQGYATEAAKMLVGFGLSVLNQPRLISLIEPSNLRSVAVAKRLGMTPGESFRVLDRFDVTIWEITANRLSAT